MLCESDIADAVKFLATIMAIKGQIFKFYINDDVVSWENIGSQ